MTGKEALIRILSEFANGEKKLSFSDILDLKRIVSKDLEQLAKYMRAFEILKDNCHVSNYVVDGVNSGKKITFNTIRELYDKEEYELLEELMNTCKKE